MLVAISLGFVCGGILFEETSPLSQIELEIFNQINRFESLGIRLIQESDLFE